MEEVEDQMLDVAAGWKDEARYVHCQVEILLTLWKATLSSHRSCAAPAKKKQYSSLQLSQLQR